MSRLRVHVQKLRSINLEFSCPLDSVVIIHDCLRSDFGAKAEVDRVVFREELDAICFSVITYRWKT